MTVKSKINQLILQNPEGIGTFEIMTQLNLTPGVVLDALLELNKEGKVRNQFPSIDAVNFAIKNAQEGHIPQTKVEKRINHYLSGNLSNEEFEAKDVILRELKNLL